MKATLFTATLRRHVAPINRPVIIIFDYYYHYSEFDGLHEFTSGVAQTNDGDNAPTHRRQI